MAQVVTDIPCNRCSSNLIQLSKVTEKISGFSSPVTNIKYKCSNKACQDEADTRLAEALAKRQEQEKARLLRAAERATKTQPKV